MTTIILQRYANREYRLSQQDLVKRQKMAGDKACDRKSEKYAQAVVDTYVLQQNLESGLVGDCSNASDRLLTLTHWDKKRGIRSLDIISEFRQNAATRKNKGGWGFQAKPTKFGKNARHRLLEAGAVIDQEFGLNCYETTLTVPGSLREAFKVVANYSGWLCDRLLREVRRNPETQHWFYVWEWQKRGALHLHFAIAGSNLSEVKKVSQQLEFNWFELLLELEQKTGVEIFRKNRYVTWRNRPDKWQSHVSRINKSVAAYFSKYAGKHTNDQPKSGYSFYPARWWGSSRAVKQGIELRRERYEFEGSREYCSEIFKYLFGWLEQIGSIKTYSYKYDLGTSKLGTSLGEGEVYINYYHDEDFQRLQNWEPYVIEHCYRLGEHDADMDSAIYADMHPLLRRHEKSVDYDDISAQTWRESITPLPSSHSQHSLSKGKLSNARSTQAEPLLALRARLLQSLGGEDGKVSSRTDTTISGYEQGCLFDTNAYLG